MKVIGWLNMMLRSSKYLKQSRKGMAVVGLSIAVAVVVMVAGLGLLMQAGMNEKNTMKELRGIYAEQASKTAVVLAKSLINSSQIVINSTTKKWESALKTPSPLWLMKNDQLIVNHCMPEGDLSATGAPSDISKCEKFTSNLSFGMIKNGMQKVDVSTTFKSVQKNLTASILIPPSPPLPPGFPDVCFPKDLAQFEEFNAGKKMGKSEDDFMKKTYGISFKNLQKNEEMRVAQITQKGDSKPGFEAWASALCPGAPARNRLCNGGNAGARALSVSNSMNTYAVSFEVNWEAAVKEFSFDMLDFDGGEHWVLTAYDAAGVKLKSQTYTSAGGYGANTGNNNATEFRFSHTDAKIRKVTFTGDKSINIYGFAIDNFKTGLKACPK